MEYKHKIIDLTAKSLTSIPSKTHTTHSELSKSYTITESSDISENISDDEPLPKFTKQVSRSKSPLRSNDLQSESKVRPASGNKPAPLNRGFTFGKQFSFSDMKKSLGKTPSNEPVLGLIRTPSIGKKDIGYEINDVLKLEVTLDNELASSYKFNNTRKILAKLRFSEPANFQRASVDIACVLDISQSKDEEKLTIIKKMVCKLIEILDDDDRMAIITYGETASVVYEFTEMNTWNKIKMEAVVNKIYAQPGKSTEEGLKLAISMLEQRKQYKLVSGIFLMTDGIDPDNKSLVKKAEFNESYEEIFQKYTIENFIIGDKAKSNFLKKNFNLIADNTHILKSIYDCNTVALNAFHSITSTFGVAGKLTINPIQSEYFSKDITLDATFDFTLDREILWKKNEHGGYSTNINHIKKTSNSDFIIEVTIPPLIRSIHIEAQTIPIIEARFTFQSLKNDTLSTSVALDSLVSHKAETNGMKNSQTNGMRDSQTNDLTWLELFRSKVLGTIKFAVQNLADKKKYTEAEELLVGLKRFISTSRFNEHKFFGVLMTALNTTVNDLKPERYENGGRSDVFKRIDILTLREIL